MLFLIYRENTLIEVLDFNRAYNPPCVYSASYSCPFARPQNDIPVAIRAGATWYQAHD